MPVQYENLKPVRPRKGMPILFWWRRFVAWAQSLPVIVGPNVRLSRSILGTKVLVRSSNPVRTPFRVSHGGRTLRISAGTVDGEVPWIGLDRSGSMGNVRLNGDRGKDLEPLPIGQVRYELNVEDGPGADGRSFVTIAAHLLRAREADLTSPGQSAETLRIEHRSDLSPAYRETSRLASGACYHTLAILYWNPDTGAIERVGQVCHHHLQIVVDADGVGFFVGT